MIRHTILTVLVVELAVIIEKERVVLVYMCKLRIGMVGSFRNIKSIVLCHGSFALINDCGDYASVTS